MGNPHHENVCEAMAGQAEIERLTALVDRLKLEAQIHAQEARTANATIYEIYQCVTGGKGEPGNWNGARPVAALVAERDALLAPFKHIDALDWDYIINLMICNVRHPQDAQNLIWLEAMKALRAAISPASHQREGE